MASKMSKRIKKALGIKSQAEKDWAKTVKENQEWAKAMEARMKRLGIWDQYQSAMGGKG